MLFGIDFNKFTNKVNELSESNCCEYAREGFDMFMYDTLSIDDDLSKDNILNLNEEYIERMIKLIESISFYYGNDDLLEDKDYMSLTQIYTFNIALQNFKNASEIDNKNILPKSMMFF